MSVRRTASALGFALVAILATGLPVDGGFGPGPSVSRTHASAPIAQDPAVALDAPGRSASLAAWEGSVDLYRPGVFSTQKTWIWCTAAGAQIMRNIVHDRDDHSRASQKRYFRYMRAHQRYPLPLADGVDPTGWAAGLRRWVDPRYRVVANGGFKRALRSAVTSLRLTDLPVAIAVGHGSHAWVLTGFSASADPAATRRFRISSVRVVGPLWGLQSRAYGYDMRPDTRLTREQLRGFFTPWHYPGIDMVWEGRWLAIQPVGS
jgi:hypothetical protein